jgi:hypothetical protein
VIWEAAGRPAERALYRVGVAYLASVGMRVIGLPADCGVTMCGPVH